MNEKKDDRAGLIGATDTGHGETLPRPTKPQRSRTRAVTVEDIYRVDRSAVERQLGHPIRTLAPWDEKPTSGPRYCPPCDTFMKARTCKACGMPTEKAS